MTNAPLIAYSNIYYGIIILYIIHSLIYSSNLSLLYFASLVQRLPLTSISIIFSLPYSPSLREKIPLIINVLSDIRHKL